MDPRLSNNMDPRNASIVNLLNDNMDPLLSSGLVVEDCNTQPSNPTPPKIKKRKRTRKEQKTAKAVGCNILRNPGTSGDRSARGGTCRGTGSGPCRSSGA